MGTGAAELERQDAHIFEELAWSRILSTGQLAALCPPEPMERRAARLVGLCRLGFLRQLPRVATPAGPVSAWARADEPLPAPGLPALARAAIRLNALQVALRGGPRPVRWSLSLEAPLSAELQVGARHLLLVDGTRPSPTPPELARSQAGLVLLLFEVGGERARAVREVARWQRQLGRAVRVCGTTFEGARRVLRARIQAAPASRPAPTEPLSEQQAAAICGFLGAR